MSTNLPPTEPGQPEYLDSGSGGPFARPDTQRRGGRRTAVIAAVAGAGVLLVGAGAWAAWSFFATGAQPAEALPDTTIAYVSVDLDPKGAQKIEAIRTLQKFPAFKDNVDLGAEDDIRERIFEEIQGSTDSCDGLDYDDDIASWLGDRMAVAAVDTGEDVPTAIFVLQVTDDGAAEDGLAGLSTCGGSSDDASAWAIQDGWAVIGESQDVVDQVTEDTGKGTLAADDDFDHWTDEAGDTGIVSMYAAPAAGDFIADNLDELGEGFGGLSELAGASSSTGVGYTGSTQTRSSAADDGADALRDFGGAAATIRFADGGLELEVAQKSGATEKSLAGSDKGGDVVATLPDSTGAAIGLAFGEDWLTDFLTGFAATSGSSADDLLSQLEDLTGLDLPEDASTLVGDSMALSVGSDVDTEALSLDDPSGIPLGLKIQGDADGIESVLDQLRSSLEVDDDVLASGSEGDMVAISPSEDYLADLLEDGDLGDSQEFERVVENAGEASIVVYVNFDAGDNWLAGLAGEDGQVRDNLEPLEALGVSAWIVDDTVHGVVKLTTD